MGYDVLSDNDSPASRTTGGRPRAPTVRSPSNPSHHGTLKGTVNLSTALLSKRPSSASPRGKRSSTSPKSPSSRTSSPSWKTQVIAQLSVSTTNIQHPQLSAMATISTNTLASLEGQGEQNSSYGQVSGNRVNTTESLGTDSKMSFRTHGTEASSGTTADAERTWRRPNLMVNTEVEEAPPIALPLEDASDGDSLEACFVGPGRCFENTNMLSPTSKKIGDVLGTKHCTRLVQELRWYLLSIEEQLVVELRSFLPKCVRRVNLDSKHTVITRMRGAILFADVSGFTAMTEKLAEKKNGAETLSACLNKFFTPMIDIITAYRGDVIKFSGDALTIVFEESEDTGIGSWSPCGTPGCDHDAFELACLRACACSLEIHKKLHYFDIGVDVKLATHIGVGAGRLAMLQVGGMYKRYEYVIVGLPLEQIAHACPLAEPGETVLSPETWEIVSPFFKKGPPLPEGSAPGYDLLEGMKGTHTLAQVKHAATLCLNGFMMTPRGKYDWATRTDRLKRFIPRAVVQHFQAGTAGNVNEMRNVTIVFVQISSQNVLSDQGSEIAQMIMLAMQRATYGMEGNVNKFLVDDKGLLIVAAFGLPPLVHFDDPLRAIICCFDMIESLQEMGIDGRFGITTGRVFCGIVGSNSRREYTVMGDTVNLSARLMASTDSLTVLIDHATYERVMEDVECEVLPPIKVKGKEEPIACYRPKNPREMSGGVSCRRRKTWGRRETAIGFTQLPWRAGSEMFGGPSLLTLSEKWESRDKLEAIYRMGESGYHFLTGPSGGGKVELCEHAVHMAVKESSALGFAITHCLQGEMFRPLMHILDSLFHALLLYGQGSMHEWLSGNDEDRHLLTMLGLVKNEGNKRRISDLYTLEAGTEKAGKIEGESLDLAKRLIDRITKVKPILITLRECVGPTIFLAPRNIFWNLANFLIETYGKSKVSADAHPVWIQIVARKIPPSTIGYATLERSVHSESLSKDETNELAEQCLLAHASKATQRPTYKLQISPPDVERLYCFLSDVALNNACFIQESIANLVASKNIVIEDGVVSVLGELSEIDIAKWSHTRMVGGAQAKIECLRPAQQQVLKIAAVFENPFSALDLHAANSAIFCRKGGFVTLYDLIKSVLAAESLVREGILVRFVYPPGAEITDKAIPETWRWTISKILLRKIAASSVLQSQRVLIKRCALIGRALRLELPKRMALKGSQYGASFTLSSIRSLLKSNVSKYMALDAEDVDSADDTPLTGDVNTFGSDLMVESPIELDRPSCPRREYKIEIVDTNAIKEPVSTLLPTLLRAPPPKTAAEVTPTISLQDVSDPTAAVDAPDVDSSPSLPSPPIDDGPITEPPLPSFDTPESPEVCGATFSSSRTLPLRLECSTVPIIPGWRMHGSPTIPSRRMKLNMRRTTAMTITEGITSTSTSLSSSSDFALDRTYVASRFIKADPDNATNDTESLSFNLHARRTIITIPSATRFPTARIKRSPENEIVGWRTGFPFIRIVHTDEEEVRCLLNCDLRVAGRDKEKRSSDISVDKQRSYADKRPQDNVWTSQTHTEPIIAKHTNGQRVPAPTPSSSCTAAIDSAVRSVRQERDAVSAHDASLTAIPFPSVSTVQDDNATGSRRPPGILRQEQLSSLMEDINDEDQTPAPRTRTSKSSSRTSKSAKSVKRAILCPVVTYISQSGSQHLLDTPPRTPDSSDDEGGRRKSVDGTLPVMKSSIIDMFTYTPGTLRHMIAKYDVAPLMEHEVKRVRAADRLKELVRRRTSEDDGSSLGSTFDDSGIVIERYTHTSRADDCSYTMLEDGQGSGQKVSLARKEDHSKGCPVPGVSSKKSGTSVKWADVPQKESIESLDHHKAVPGILREASFDSAATSCNNTIGRTTMDSGSSHDAASSIYARGDIGSESIRTYGRDTTVAFKHGNIVRANSAGSGLHNRRSKRREHISALHRTDNRRSANADIFEPNENATVAGHSLCRAATKESDSQSSKGTASNARRTCKLTRSITSPPSIGTMHSDNV
eukprot:GEMP01000298.1.p1 GENE.GEMP01000298.1~~GEMP01000298.1.p1  ORF type:complete len:2004 (+),score=372.97 GEMP01000298.1:470-6481(+)